MIYLYIVYNRFILCVTLSRNCFQCQIKKILRIVANVLSCWKDSALILLRLAVVAINTYISLRELHSAQHGERFRQTSFPISG